MNQASLYAKVNVQTRRDTEQVLKEYANRIIWRNDGYDALIDIGTGPGNTLIEFVYPLLPKNFKELIGSDISEKMVSYARQHFIENDRIKFEVLDIGIEVLPMELRGRFDHVTSFYALHWVQNQRKMFENIYELIRDDDGGDCLLLFLATNFIFEVYEPLSKLTKWSNYMQDYRKFISPYQYSKDAAAEVSQLLQYAGFVDCRVECRNEVFVYKGVQLTRDIFKSICPFFERIPAEQHEEFLSDYLDALKNMNMRRSIECSDDYNFVTPYKLVVVHARKSKGELKNLE